MKSPLDDPHAVLTTFPVYLSHVLNGKCVSFEMVSESEPTYSFQVEGCEGVYCTIQWKDGIYQIKPGKPKQLKKIQLHWDDFMLELTRQIKQEQERALLPYLMGFGSELINMLGGRGQLLRVENAPALTYTVILLVSGRKVEFCKILCKDGELAIESSSAENKAQADKFLELYETMTKSLRAATKAREKSSKTPKKDLRK